MGKLFKPKVRLLLYPMLDESENLVKGEDVDLPEHLSYLFKHLWSQGLINDYEKFKESNLTIQSDEVLESIRQGVDWKDCVPENIVSIVEENLELINRRLEQ